MDGMTVAIANAKLPSALDVICVTVAGAMIVALCVSSGIDATESRCAKRWPDRETTLAHRSAKSACLVAHSGEMVPEAAIKLN